MFDENNPPGRYRRALLKMGATGIVSSVLTGSAVAQSSDDADRLKDHMQEMREEHGEGKVIKCEINENGSEEGAGRHDVRERIKFEDGTETDKKTSTRGNGVIFTEFDGEDYRIKIDSSMKSKAEKRSEELMDEMLEESKSKAESRNN